MKRCLVIAAWAGLISFSCSGSPARPAIGEPDAAGSASRTAAPSNLKAAPSGGSDADWAPPARPDADPAAPLGPDAAVPPAISADASTVLATPDLQAPAEVSPATTMPRILRVHDLTVDTLTARVVYAHRVDAKSGTAGQRGVPLSDAELAQQFGSQNLKVSDLAADILYAHDIHAGRVDMTETNASTINIEKP
jgi:hypothetical protein